MQPVGDLVGQVLGDLGLDGVALAHRIGSDWPELVGEQVAAHCRPLGLRAGNPWNGPAFGNQGGVPSGAFPGCGPSPGPGPAVPPGPVGVAITDPLWQKRYIVTI